jgi:hypothetical protein
VFPNAHTRENETQEKGCTCHAETTLFALVELVNFFLFDFLSGTSAWGHPRYSQPLRNTRGDPKEQYLTARTPRGDQHSLEQVHKQAHKPGQYVGCASRESD